MNGRSGIPSRAIRSIAQLRPVASSSPVVDAFVASLASSPHQPQVDQVGHQRDRLARRRGSAPALGHQLKDGVDRHRLDACPAVQLFPRHELVGARHDLVGHALVAVVERQPEHPVVAVEERVVDPPRVDADAVEAAGRAGPGAGEPLERVREKLR